MIKEETLVDDSINFIILLNRHEYWSKQLWRKLEAHKNDDVCDVEIAYYHAILKYNGIFRRPIGCSWSKECSESRCEEYLKDYEDIFDDYQKWQYTKRRMEI